MKLPCMRMKMWELTTAVAVVALMLWAGVGWLKAQRKGAPIILAGNGLEFRIHSDDPFWEGRAFHNLSIPDRVERGYWHDGFGLVPREQIVLESENRLRVRGRDYGKLKKGDVVEIDSGWVKINGWTRWGVATGPN